MTARTFSTPTIRSSKVPGGGVSSVSNYGGGTGTPWFVMDTSRAVKPIIFQKRREYEFIPLANATDPNVFMQKKFIYGVDCRVNTGFGLWQMAYCSQQALTADNLNAAITAMMGFKSDAGVSLGITPTILVVPPALRSAALTLLHAEIIDATTNINRNALEPVITPWLS